ncbi:MAG: hypothetical protein EZS28_006596 [Streblomastix strix]|uniref:Uncharacterized protein n=1 Tax=Streblomastix strix TaxID=222440 RepID=A0A5J4WSU5_9EUKA|nr:MAG: hypothetical protein EZS28_006596 [Streblomastix strix]
MIEKAIIAQHKINSIRISNSNARAIFRHRKLVENKDAEAVAQLRNALSVAAPTGGWWHCELFFEDGTGDHFGFYPTGDPLICRGTIRPDIQENLPYYRRENCGSVEAGFARRCIEQDMDLIRNGQLQQYQLFIFDCRIWAETVLDRYFIYELEQNKILLPILGLALVPLRIEEELEKLRQKYIIGKINNTVLILINF